MWTNGLIAASVVGCVVGLIVVCCWLSSMVQCVQHMYRYWCTCCHRNNKETFDLQSIRHTRVIINGRGDTQTTLARNSNLPPSYSSVFQQESAISIGSASASLTQSSIAPHGLAPVVVHRCGSDMTGPQIEQTSSCGGQPDIVPDQYQTPGEPDTTMWYTTPYDMDRRLCNKRPHYYQLVFAQSPDDDEAEYPDVNSPFINFPTRRTENCSWGSPITPPIAHSGINMYRTTFPTVEYGKPIKASDFVSPAGSDCFHYVKRSTSEGPPVPPSSLGPHTDCPHSTPSHQRHLSLTHSVVTTSPSLVSSLVSSSTCIAPTAPPLPSSSTADSIQEINPVQEGAQPSRVTHHPLFKHCRFTLFSDRRTQCPKHSSSSKL